MLRNMGAVEWDETVETFYRALCVYDPTVLAIVFEESIAHNKHFPTTGDLQRAARSMNHRLEEGSPPPPQQQNLLTDPGVRPDPGGNAVEQLGAKGYDESRELGLNPGADIPPEIFADRMKKLWEAFDQVETIQTPGYRRKRERR